MQASSLRTILLKKIKIKRIKLLLKPKIICFVSETTTTILNKAICCDKYMIFFFLLIFLLFGRAWTQSSPKMLTFLNRGCVFAIKNTGQYTSEEKLNQMWVIGPQNFAFAQNRYFKHILDVGLLFCGIIHSWQPKGGFNVRRLSSNEKEKGALIYQGSLLQQKFQTHSGKVQRGLASGQRGFAFYIFFLR